MQFNKKSNKFETIKTHLNFSLAETVGVMLDGGHFACAEILAINEAGGKMIFVVRLYPEYPEYVPDAIGYNLIPNDKYLDSKWFNYIMAVEAKDLHKLPSGLPLRKESTFFPL